MVLEFAQVPTFARFIKNGRINLCNYVENAIFRDPVCYARYSEETMEALGERITKTLKIKDARWWK